MRKYAQIIVAILMIATLLTGCSMPAGNVPISGSVTIGDATYSFDGNMTVSGQIGDVVAAGSTGFDANGNPYPWIPPTIETPARECQAYIRDDGFHMDYAVSQTNGETYDVTIVSSIPAGGDLCDPYRIVQDGANSSMIQDRLPQPPSTRVNFERDFTFLAQDWADIDWVYYAGVACRIEIDHDKDVSTPRKGVLDENGELVGYTHGTQRFAPVFGGWYMAVCDGPAEATGVRFDPHPWQRN